MKNTSLVLFLVTCIFLRSFLQFPAQTSIDMGLLLTLPLFAAAFWSLAELYTIKSAYLMLFWVPLSISALILEFGVRVNHWTEMLYPLSLYTSAMLLVVGVGLIIYTYRSKREWVSLLLATSVAGLPVLLLIYQMISIANDPEFDKTGQPFG